MVTAQKEHEIDGDIQKGRQTDIQTERQTERQIDRRKDRQTESHKKELRSSKFKLTLAKTADIYNKLIPYKLCTKIWRCHPLIA